MEQEKPPFALTRSLRLQLDTLLQQNGPIYNALSYPKLVRLEKLGFLTRSEPKGAFHITSKVAETLASFPPAPEKAIRKTAHEHLRGHIQKLQNRVDAAQILEHLEHDTGRGIDTSPKIMRPKGRRQPRRDGK